MAADLVLVDALQPALQPLYWTDRTRTSPRTSCTPRLAADVTDVMVGGRWIVRRRRLLTADARALWRDLARRRATLHDSLQGTHDAHDTDPKAPEPKILPLVPLRSTAVYPLGVIGVQIGIPTTLELLAAHPEPGLTVAVVVAPAGRTSRWTRARWRRSPCAPACPTA
jgi:hypothetical protein